MFHREGGRTKRRVFPVSPPGFNRKEENFSSLVLRIPRSGSRDGPLLADIFPLEIASERTDARGFAMAGRNSTEFPPIATTRRLHRYQKGPSWRCYCPCSIIMRLIQIDDCRRLFARSLRICEWRRIIRAARLSVRRSHAALHVGLIFNRRCVQNAGRYARTGSRAKPPPCPDNNQRVTPILSLLAQY